MRAYILFFIACLSPCALTAQQRLGVGDDAPEFDAFRWIRGEPLANLLKGKIHLIEFGASWCTPCARAIPELSRIADEYRGKVNVISVFVMEPNDHKNDLQPAYVTRVRNYVSKREEEIRYNIVVDDPQQTMERTWLKNAGLAGIPHIFVIDTKGRIAGIETSPTIAETILKEVLSQQYDLKKMIAKWQAREDDKVKYDNNKLLLIDGNGGGEEEFLFRSLLTAYNGRIRAAKRTSIESYRWGPSDTIFNDLKDRVQAIGVSIADLYYLAYSDTLTKLPYSRNPQGKYPDTVAYPHLKSAYGKQWHLAVLKVADKSPFIVERRKIQNRYNYSLKVPNRAGTAAYLQHCLRSDLNKFFGYHAELKKLKMPVWRLIVADQTKLNKTVSRDQSMAFVQKQRDGPFLFTNAKICDIIWKLSTNFGYTPYDYGKLKPEEQLPFIDSTHFTPMIDFIYDEKWSFDEMRGYLATIGLSLEMSTMLMDVVVISD